MNPTPNPVPNPTPQQPAVTPVDQAAALQRELAQAKAELRQLKQAPPQPSEQPQPQPTLVDLPVEDALQALQTHPVAFIQQVIAEEANQHLYTLREQAELQGALSAARKTIPDFAKFEPFILQEVAELILHDEDGVIDPWSKLFEKSTAIFQEKFKDILKNNPDLLAAQKPQVENAHVEGKTARMLPALPPSFTRKQIAAMSMEDFLKNEAAIAEAMKHNRIR